MTNPKPKPKPNPQNPYHSSVVRASAGSGKTYQLSRRFLYLVGAGADPSSILTVTFTKKAAAEMRARILDLSAHLLASEEERRNFERDLKDFYETRTNPLIPRPLTATETASLILASTQSLKISTIDAILLEWLKKFPYESSGDGALRVPPKFELLSPFQEEKNQRRSWARTLRSIDEGDGKALLSLLQNPEDIHFVAIENRIRQLQKHESFLWLLKEQRPHLPTRLVTHPIDEDWTEAGEEGLVEAMTKPFQALSESIAQARRDELLRALEDKTLGALRQGKFLTGDLSVHGNTFRTAKKGGPYASAIETIDRLALSYSSFLLKRRLNETGTLLMQIFEAYQEELGRLKFEERQLSFGDLIKGGYFLFSHDDAVGARYLLNRTIRHLLLDEFQDTSILQWTVFQTMAEEMLSGEGYRSSDELNPTLFIVGDAKQSIYGFREADAEILSTAAQFMVERNASHIELSASYRTHPLLLQFVNEVMTEVMEEFPVHLPAKKDDAVLIQGRASLVISPLFRASDPGSSGNPIEDEAEYLARTLEERLAKEEEVYDKTLKGYRPLRASDCAVLYRNSTHARTYAEALRKKGISVRIEEGQSFFARPEILDAMALLRLLAYPGDIQSAFHVLKSPLARVPEKSLLLSLRVLKTSSEESGEAKNRGDLVTPFLESIGKEAEELRSFFEKRHELRPSQGIENFFRRSEALLHYAKAFGEEEGPLAVANLNKFLELVLDTDANGKLCWMDVLNLLEGRAREEAVSLSSVSEDSVQLMTIHKAKGLEWPLVVLTGTGEEWERPDLYWAKLKDTPIGTGLSYVGKRSELLMEDPHFHTLGKSLLEESLRENHRLLYVAITRAQYELIVTGYQRKDREEAYFHGLMTRAAKTLGFQLADDGLSLRKEERDDLPKAPLVEKISERKATDPLLTLAQFRKNEKANLDSVKILAPARLLSDKEGEGPVSSQTLQHASTHAFPTEAGTFIHKALEQSMRAFSTRQTFEFDYRSTWFALRRHHSELDFENALTPLTAEIQKVLASDAWQRLIDRQTVKSCEVELPIAYLKDGMLVRGVIDLLLERVDGTRLLVDYKTSTEALEHKDLLKLCFEKKYDRQLALYKEGVARLYPSHSIDCAVFFTATQTLIILPNL